jgi:hypothetical protein
MAKHSLEPQGVDDDTWYYEDKRGIDVVHRVKFPNGTTEIIRLVIPWRKLEATMKRHRSNP